MNAETARAIGSVVAKHLHADRLVPANLLKELATIMATEAPQAGQLFVEAWQGQSKQRVAAGRPAMDIRLPLILSRGYHTVLPEEELTRYLPEEKILINKDLFRERLKKVDFGRLDPATERKLVDSLAGEALGLSRDDAMLYFTLIKINKLAGASVSQATAAATTGTDPVSEARELIALAGRVYGIAPEVLAKANGGRAIDARVFEVAVAALIKARKTQVAVLRNFLGKQNDRFSALFKDFLQFVTGQRGEAADELIAHAGLYLLLNGSDPDFLTDNGFAVPLVSWATDKLGRIRTLYYVAVLFGRSLLYVLFAQVYEISIKYRNSDPTQAQKLKRLYGADDRLAMLVTNALNIAAKRVGEYRTESREILALFKKFVSSRKTLIRPSDLFDVDYD